MGRTNIFISTLISCILFILIFSPSPAKGAPKEKYPEKNINIIIPFSPGSSIDMAMRGTAPYLEKYLGVRIILTSEPGADGKIGYSKIFRAKPDGYTYGIGALPPLTLFSVAREVNFKAGEFTPVFAWTLDNQILFVNAETYKTFAEFAAAAKKDYLSLSTTALGASSSHLAGVLMAESLKLKIKFIGYSGSGDMLAALAGKHVQAAIAMPQSALGLVKGGKIRPLLSFATEEDPVIPEAPTAKSLGYDIRPLPYIRGLLGPPNIPREKVAVIERAFIKVLQDADYQKWAKERRFNLISLSADEFGKEIQREMEIMGTYGKLLKPTP